VGVVNYPARRWVATRRLRAAFVPEVRQGLRQC
jgi:hypothetical protein